MSTIEFSLCSHVKTNGVFCGSPALHGQDYCYFHHQWRKNRPRRAPGAQPALVLPLLEDANAVQIALQRVIQAIAANQIDNKRAGLLLYALQTASFNLKHTSFEHDKLREQLDEGVHVCPDLADYDPAPCDADNPGPVVHSAAAPAPQIAPESFAPTPASAATTVAAPSPQAASRPAFAPPVVTQTVETKKMGAAPSPPRKRPQPECDAELTDDELIQAIRSLAGLK